MSTNLKWSIQRPPEVTAPDDLKHKLRIYFGEQPIRRREVCRDNVTFMAFLRGLVVCNVEGAADLQKVLDNSDYPVVVLEEV